MADPLPWIQVACMLPDSDEADALEEATGVERAWTHLVELWCWVGRTRPDGDLTDMSPRRIAKRASWPADPETFVQALRDIGLLVEEDGKLKFSGWDKRYAATLAKRERDKERKKKAREDGADGSGGRRGDGAAPSQGQTGESGEPSKGKRRGEERRPEETKAEETKPKKRSKRGAKPKVEDVPDSPYAIGPNSPPGWPPDPAGGVQALLAFVTKGDTLDSHWSKEIPQLDGRSGRPTIPRILENAWDKLVLRPPREKAVTPRRFRAWLDPEGQRAFTSWSRERRARGAPSANGPPMEDHHGNRIIVPDGYTWDERDRMALEMGRFWTGSGWRTAKVTTDPDPPPPSDAELFDIRGFVAEVSASKSATGPDSRPLNETLEGGAKT